VGLRYVEAEKEGIAHGCEHEKISSEMEADPFADLLNQAMKQCLQSCKPCER
jgi:hypothetical protein